MLNQIGKDAKLASFELSVCSTDQKNRALEVLAKLLEERSDAIIAANTIDMTNAKAAGQNAAFCDRLLLTRERIAHLARDVWKISQLRDPVGEVIDERTAAQGIKLQRHRVPLGVIGVIYESRPNVTIDIAALCLKTGNAAILRGGRETHHTNVALVDIIQSALTCAGLPSNAIQSIRNPDRKYVTELLKLDRYVDMLIPRGGAKLHQLCREQATIPVITGGIGVCHTFIDESADLDKALAILVNAKTQRPSTCNTTETVLVHRRVPAEFWPKLSNLMAENRVTLHADPCALVYLQEGAATVKLVQENELRSEWLSLDLNVVIVDDVSGAIAHIREYGSAHSEAILTQSKQNADLFIHGIDSAAVYVNASTRFTDGGQFGLGAEVAVSTQKLHARGPMGLDALTTYKWIGIGDHVSRI